MNYSYPNGDLKIIAMESCKDLGDSVDLHLRYKRTNRSGDEVPATFLTQHNAVRFSNGEGKVILNESVRGKDVFILCDVGNHSCTYPMFGHINHKSPDDHFQDLKRIIAAIGGKSARTTVIMPRLYSSRQDKRNNRESLDCALALRELENLGVKNIITFDVHDSRVQNAVPLCSFENFYATYEIVKEFMVDEPDITKDKDNLLVISPDSGAMGRAIYYSTILGTDVGLFYKRRDYSQIVRGKNPIVQHEYMGQMVEGKNVLIIDDLIGSGDSMVDIFEELIRSKAAKIFVAVTFGWFVEGIARFEKFFRNGRLNRVYTTNLTYVSDEARNSEWLKVVDMSECVAEVMDILNRNQSLEPMFDATDELKKVIDEVRNEKTQELL